MLIQTGDILFSSLQQAADTVLSFLPDLIVAIIVFAVGYLIASWIGTAVKKLFDAIKIDPLLAKLGFSKALSKAGLRLDAGHFIGQLVKWFIIFVVLLASADILGLEGVSLFLNTVLLPYIPRVIVAAVILLLGVLFANLVQHLVRVSVSAAGVKFSQATGVIAWWAIAIFAFITALEQLQIDLIFLRTLYTGIIAMLTIAGGIALGLGGKEAAADFVNKFRNQLRDRDHSGM